MTVTANCNSMNDDLQRTVPEWLTRGLCSQAAGQFFDGSPKSMLSHPTKMRLLSIAYESTRKADISSAFCKTSPRGERIGTCCGTLR
jgi:hypothetical protein